MSAENPELGRAVDAALEAGGELAKAITALLAIPDPALGKYRADRWDALRRVQAALAAHGAAVVRLHEVAR